MKSGFWRGALIRARGRGAGRSARCPTDGRAGLRTRRASATRSSSRRARPSIADSTRKRKRCSSRWPRRHPKGEAALELALFYEMLGRARRSAAAARTHRQHAVSGRGPRPSSTRGSAVPPARSASFSSPTTPIASPPRKRRPIRRMHTGWGELFLQRPQQRRGGEVVSGRARRPTPSGFRRCSAWHRRSSMRTRREPRKPVEQALSLDPDAWSGAPAPGAARARQERSRSGEGVDCESEVDQSRQPRCACAERRRCLRRRPSSDFQREAAAALKINPRFSGAYRVPGRPGRVELPLRRSRGAEPQGARDRSERRADALGARRAAAAHRRRSRGAARCSRDRSRSTSSIRPRTTC